MAQFKIIDRVGSPPYRYIIQHTDSLVFGYIRNKIGYYTCNRKIGNLLDYDLLDNKYDCLQIVNKFTGTIEYEEDVPF